MEVEDMQDLPTIAEEHTLPQEVILCRTAQVFLQKCLFEHHNYQKLVHREDIQAICRGVFKGSQTSQ